jgi:ornithine--oxo-acid transaminase
MTSGADNDHAPHASSATLIELERLHGAPNYQSMPVVIARGEGVWLFDVEGRRYLDMLSAYSAVSLGHHHPRIVEAARRQLDKIGVVSRAFHSDQLGPLLQEVTRLTGLDAMLPMNTGAEAVETAIKALRRHASRHRDVPEGQAEIIVAAGNFHGRTTTIVGFSSEADYRAGFGPFAPGFVSVPFGDAQAVERAISPNTAGVLVEPIQGEAGIIVPPPGYLASLRDICTRKNVPLVFDEVQSGLGRTGRMFCFEHEDARPDGLILGKALGGGLVPISAFVARRALIDVFDPGSHGSTFGGNPFAAAIAHETLRVLIEEELVERSGVLGDELLLSLSAIQHPAIVDVRGKGLWVGVELNPAFASGEAVCLAMMRRGVLTKEVHASVIRFAPPFVITSEEIAMAVDVFRQALDDI